MDMRTALVTGDNEDVGENEARQLLDTVVFAPARPSRLALPTMRRRGHGTHNHQPPDGQGPRDG